MENTITIGQKITSLIKKLELERSQIVKFLNIDQSTLSKYESGKRKIPLEKLEKLSDLFGITLSELLEENETQSTINLKFAFRKNNIDYNDLETIAEFRKLIKNYFKIERIERKHGIEISL